MPKNNGDARKAARRSEAAEREQAALGSGKTVAQREADRGYTGKLDAELRRIQGRES